MLAKHIEVAINMNIIFIKFVQICVHVFLIYKILYIDVEGENVTPNVARKIRSTKCVIQEEGCTPTMSYPSDISDIP